MPELFVIMSFGSRTVDHVPEGVIDFDEVYAELIRPAGESVGWTVSRIDELAEPGLISDHYLRSILAADLVVAEITVPNGNVYYELGIRQAVAGGGTILLAARGTPRSI